MSREEERLKNSKTALELLQSEANDSLVDYKCQISLIDKELKDLGKIALPPIVFDDINEAIEEAVNEFDFSDTDNFDIEYGIEYDGKVHCESHDFNESTELIDMIMTHIAGLFTEAECDEELDTTEDDNHRGEIGG